MVRRSISRKKIIENAIHLWPRNIIYSPLLWDGRLWWGEKPGEVLVCFIADLIFSTVILSIVSYDSSPIVAGFYRKSLGGVVICKTRVVIVLWQIDEFWGKGKKHPLNMNYWMICDSLSNRQQRNKNKTS